MSNNRDYTIEHTFTRNGEERELLIAVDYHPGYPASGLSGPPEYYDPGEPPEIIFKSIKHGDTELLYEFSDDELTALDAEIADKLQELSAADYEDEQNAYAEYLAERGREEGSWGTFC